MKTYMKAKERGTKRRRSDTSKYEKEGDIEKVLGRMSSKYVKQLDELGTEVRDERRFYVERERSIKDTTKGSQRKGGGEKRSKERVS